ncbi:uncharacterized protein TRIVIDRAFT_69571 [Trichoderma virens Gv29-8]|uniref:Uncharacterized protein n=1 Tax=Hypocrea virens (strain Gv29-8 / FGSC 10586) TaxID=413071 RepID=G9MGK9_HYPVG|nr:uncharacterized protein TRIVIDRAFT_69571 [Trichoderma virens Gv29-8]EHK26656.1 hypothetical protein TRIVIDRAFT_69571 [Trichoderma virens Gv29-8]
MIISLPLNPDTTPREPGGTGYRWASTPDGENQQQRNSAEAAGMAETELRCRIAVVGYWRCHKAAFGGVETQKLLQVLTSGRRNRLVKEKARADVDSPEDEASSETQAVRLIESGVTNKRQIWTLSLGLLFIYRPSSDAATTW